MNKKSEVVRVYLPPDTNTLLSVADHCLRSKQYVNVIVAGKQPALTYLTMDEAIAHCTRGLGIWPWASTTDREPDVVLACAGDAPTLETAGGRGPAAYPPARPEGPGDQSRGGPHAARARHRAPARAGRQRSSTGCSPRTSR